MNNIYEKTVKKVNLHPRRFVGWVVKGECKTREIKYLALRAKYEVGFEDSKKAILFANKKEALKAARLYGFKVFRRFRRPKVKSKILILEQIAKLTSVLLSIQDKNHEWPTRMNIHNALVDLDYYNVRKKPCGMPTFIPYTAQKDD